MIQVHFLEEFFEEVLIDFCVPYDLIEHIKLTNNILLTDWDEEYYLSVGVGSHKLLFRFLEKTIVSPYEVNFYPEDFGFANVREFYDKFHCIKTYLEITGQG